MAKKRNRYKEMERYMTYALCTDTALFILYLLFAGLGVTWLKIILSILCLLLSVLMLGFLFITRELLKPRSLWLSAGAAAILICLLFSLLLKFPSPNKYRPQEENAAYQIVKQI